jgi:hypothetical protein
LITAGGVFNGGFTAVKDSLVAVIGRSHSSRMLQSHFFEGDRSNSEGFEM